MKRKPTPRPPKRSPLQQSPHITCPKCEQTTTIFVSPKRYGDAPEVGDVFLCRCGAELQMRKLRVLFLWSWEVVRTGVVRT